MSSTYTTSLLLLLPLLHAILSVSGLPTPSSSATDTIVFSGCSQIKYTPGSPYENSVNSMLTSLVNSAKLTSYNNFTIQGTNTQETLYGLFQCRGDLSTTDCGGCVAGAVSQLATLCINTCGGELQLNGCFVKYDNTSFLGVEDKTVVVRKCGTTTSSASDALSRLDTHLGYLGTSDGSYKPYRTSVSGDLSGVAQCVGDLSVSGCQDCLSDAIGRLKTDCGVSKWGDMFLAKCYARYAEGGDHSQGYPDNNNNDGDDDDDDEKTLPIIIAVIIIVVVALLLILVYFIRKSKKCDTIPRDVNVHFPDGIALSTKIPPIDLKVPPIEIKPIQIQVPSVDMKPVAIKPVEIKVPPIEIKHQPCAC